MARVLFALGWFCGRHFLLVFGVWILVIFAVVGSVRLFGAQTSNDLQLPGTGSQQVHDLLAKRFPPQQNGTNPIVFHVDTGKLTDKANASAIKSSIQEIKKTPDVHSVTNPVSSDGQNAGLLSKDGRTAFAPVLMSIGNGELDEENAQQVLDATNPAQKAGIQVAAAGSIGSDLSTEGTESSEVVGILAAIIILTLVLGSLVAMGLPIISAVVGLGVALSVVGLLGHVLSVPSTAATLATMIGLGVGIDYALFLISRHQEQLAAGVPPRESIARSVATSGSAIVFAGGTVVVALVALRVAGIPLLSTLGFASAVAVVTAVLAAITLLPALLGLLGYRINRLHLPSFRRGGRDTGSGVWRRWAGALARHPVMATLVALALLGPLIVPAFSLTFGQEDIGATPKSTTERKAYDLLTAGFGVGYNGPLQVASRFSPAVAPSKNYTDTYNQAKSLQSDLNKKQKQLPQQQQQLQDQQKQLNNQQKQLETQEQQLKTQQAQLEDQQGSLEAQKNALVGKQQQLEARKTGMQGQQQQLQVQQASLESQGQGLQQQGGSLQQQATQLRREQASLKAQQRRLQAQQATLQRKRNQLEREARALAARIRPLARELAQTLVRERILQRRIDRLADHPRLQSVLQARLESLQQREHQLRAELAPLERQARALAQQARTLQAQAAALQRQGDQLQEQADQLTRKSQALTAQKAKLKRQQAALRQQSSQLQQQAGSLQQQGAQLQEQGDQLQQQVNSLQQQGVQLQEQGDQLQQQGDDLQQQGNQLQQQGDQLQQQGDQLKSEQQQAQQEQKQAEQLQKQLTTMVTKAGGDPRNTDPRVVRLQNALAGTAGVAGLTPPQTNKKGDVVLLSVVPATGPATQRTADLLSTVRNQVIPGVQAKGGVTSYVGGYTASYADLATLISQRLLLVIGTVILLGFLLLMLAFRSLLIPLQAAVTNVLSAAAAFGVLTAAFQWGWGISALGIDTTSSGVPIASYVPLMMFAVLFGLSMDYEVFLVSHIQQHHLGGEAPRQAVASGLRSSARVIVAACLIMTMVFASFILNGDPTIKQFGVGLAGAVLLAGILVISLAPAVIMLMGKAAWWLPRWLDRLLPHMHLEGE